MSENHSPMPEVTLTLGEFKVEARALWVNTVDSAPRPFVVLKVVAGGVRVVVYCEEADQAVALGNAVRDAGMRLLGPRKGA